MHDCCSVQYSKAISPLQNRETYITEQSRVWFLKNSNLLLRTNVDVCQISLLSEREMNGAKLKSPQCSLIPHSINKVFRLIKRSKYSRYCVHLKENLEQKYNTLVTSKTLFKFQKNKYCPVTQGYLTIFTSALGPMNKLYINMLYKKRIFQRNFKKVTKQQFCRFIGDTLNIPKCRSLFSHERKGSFVS